LPPDDEAAFNSEEARDVPVTLDGVQTIERHRQSDPKKMPGTQVSLGTTCSMSKLTTNYDRSAKLGTAPLPLARSIHEKVFENESAFAAVEQAVAPDTGDLRVITHIRRFGPDEAVSRAAVWAIKGRWGKFVQHGTHAISSRM
jgi:hypothetical protein